MITLQPEIVCENNRVCYRYSPSQLEEIRHAYMLKHAKEEKPHGLHPLASNGIRESSGYHNLGYTRIAL